MAREPCAFIYEKKANSLVLVTLCEGNHFRFIEERYDEYFDFARKMEDNIKKVPNLFVISYFCSIFAEAKFHSAILKANFHCARLHLLYIWID